MHPISGVQLPPAPPGAVGVLASISLNCADPEPLAEFWSAMLGTPIVLRFPDYLGVALPGGGWIGAMRVPDYRPPTWPEGGRAAQLHLDLSVSDLDASVAAALRLGAREAQHQDSPQRWRVLLDPAGHPFCLTTVTG